MQKKLEYNTPSNEYYQEMSHMPDGAVKEGNSTTCQSKNVLRKAKSEWKVNDTFDKDALTKATLV